MRKVQRSEIVDFQTYGDMRQDFRARVMAIKEARRVHVGEHLTFHFETTETVRYQIQEMMRVERIVREADIQHEIDTYNDLLGERGQLGCTLMIEIDDEAQRDVLLRQWLALPQHLYLRTQDGRLSRPVFDEAQVGDDKLSSVQYLRFRVGEGVPAALGCDLPALRVETQLSPAQCSVLAADLAAD